MSARYVEPLWDEINFPCSRCRARVGEQCIVRAWAARAHRNYTTNWHSPRLRLANDAWAFAHLPDPRSVAILKWQGVTEKETKES